ncbi:MAG: 30S ribosomal protein S6 [Candidatus Hydrogenedentota bacterium]
MRTYEALYIIQHEASEDDVQTVTQGVETLITDEGGVIVRSEIWGKRRLAYEVKGQNEGIYVLVRFESDPGFNLKLESHFRLNESTVRFLVVLFDEKTLRLEAEQQRRNEALLAAQTERRGGDDDDEIVPRRKIVIEDVVEA